MHSVGLAHRPQPVYSVAPARDVRAAVAQRPRTAVFLTLVLTALTCLTGVSATPASAAAAVCRPAQPTARITQQPWPQQLWDLSRIPARYTGAGQTIAVIDSGVDTSHPQLRGVVAAGRDLLGKGDGRVDCVGHGTGVASLIAARKLKGVEFHGLAPGSKLLSVRASEQLGEDQGEAASPAQIADAVDWAVRNHATVINMSFSYPSQHGLEPLRAAVARAIAADVVVVAAVGNKFDRGNPPSYPASWPNVLGVGAVSQNGQRQQLSQTGSFVDITAPGDAVIVAALGGGHTEVTGTSYAAPLVAATAALVRQRFPHLSAAQVRDRLIATTDPAPGGSKNYGAGIVNPVRAITDVLASGNRMKASPLARDELTAAQIDGLRRAEQTRRNALWIAGIGAVAALVLFTLASATPQARKRQWRAGH